MKKEVELPELPKGLYWEYEETMLPLLRSNITALHILRLRIIRKWGWLRTTMVEGEWFAILPGPAEDKEAAVLMNADVVMLQLPAKFVI